MNKKRLLKLAGFLEALPPKRFDYNAWVGDDWAGKQDLSCGTTACALGWAATIPAFRKLGLQLFKPESKYDPNFVALKSSVEEGCDAYSGPPIASSVVFGLSREEHTHVFIPEMCEYREHIDCEATGRKCRAPNAEKPCELATAKQVAAHIRRFVEAGGIPGTKAEVATDRQ